MRDVEDQLKNLADYLTVGEAAKILGVSRSTMRNWDKAGKLNPCRHPVNGYRLYDRNELTALLKQVEVKTPRGDCHEN